MLILIKGKLISQWPASWLEIACSCIVANATGGNQNASSATNLTPRKREICGKRKKMRLETKSAHDLPRFQLVLLLGQSTYGSLLSATGYLATWLLGFWLHAACRMLQAGTR